MVSTSGLLTLRNISQPYLVFPCEESEMCKKILGRRFHKILVSDNGEYAAWRVGEEACNGWWALIRIFLSRKWSGSTNLNKGDRISYISEAVFQAKGIWQWIKDKMARSLRLYMGREDGYDIWWVVSCSIKERKKCFRGKCKKIVIEDHQWVKAILFSVQRWLYCLWLDWVDWV